VNLGHRPSSLFGEEFLSAPIHSPLSGHLIGPSLSYKTYAANRSQSKAVTIFQVVMQAVIGLVLQLVGKVV
jgi:hypothetical protein